MLHEDLVIRKLVPRCISMDVQSIINTVNEVADNIVTYAEEVIVNYHGLKS
jgi:hypothetical protein